MDKSVGTQQCFPALGPLWISDNWKILFNNINLFLKSVLFIGALHIYSR